MWHELWLIPVGFLVGAFGTLIGAGGGFILVPILLLVYPEQSPELITAISLAVVFVNAASGSAAYSRMGRIDYKSGVLFAVATIPGAVIGAYTVAFIPRKIFDAVFGIALLAVSVFLVMRSSRLENSDGSGSTGWFKREVTDSTGMTYRYSFNLWIGLGLSMVVGYLSSLLGIGGGIIHVPAMVGLLNFPVHLATATSHFVLAIMALAGTIVHIVNGTFQEGVRQTIYLALGVLGGAQLGAKLSTRVHGPWIIRSLAFALALVGFRILILAFYA